MALARGTRLGPYEIATQIGQGGMGEVYKATDTRLDRTVAIKVLPAEVASEPVALARFEREAKAIAALSHPNVLAIFDVGREQGVSFVVTELLDGETLRERLARGAVPLSKAVACASQLAEGLAAAHGRGIIHRDIKPENVFLTDDGRVKLLDFGLARSEEADVSAADAETRLGMTIAHTVLGTVGYMSPEQARGERAKATSDVFSFGVVLYEMLSGRRAFQGRTPIELLSAVLRDEPPPLSQAGVHVPARLERILRRCLEKNPVARFQSARDLAFSLSDGGEPVRVALASDVPTAEASPDGPRSLDRTIAVLPFLNLSPDPDTEYFADGVSEEIINVLTNVPKLKVIARTSAFTFKGANTDLREIGRRLNVGTVLEGSVRRAGRRIRITTKLVDVSTAHPVWSEQYDRELGDVFAIQDEIAQAVARRLQPGRSAVPLPRRERGTESLEAYEAYLRGRFFEAKGTPEGYATSVRHYERAIALEPRYAQAYGGLANACYLWSFVAQTRTLMDRARVAVDKALALGGNFAEAHATLGGIKFFGEWDWSGAIAAHERALALNPGVAAGQAIVLTNLGRVDEAAVLARRAIELDPLSPIALENLQFCLHQTGSYEGSLQYSERALELAPDFLMSHLVRGFALADCGQLSDAEQAFRAMLSIIDGEPMARAGLVLVRMRAGRRLEAEEVARDLERNAGPPGGQWGTSGAWACAAIGDVDGAFAWIEKAIAAREPFVASLPSFAWWDSLRSDARFEAVLRRLRFPDWSIEVSSARAKRNRQGQAPPTP